MKNKRRLLFVFTGPHPVHKAFVDQLSDQFTITRISDGHGLPLVKLMMHSLHKALKNRKTDIVITENGAGALIGSLVSFSGAKWIHLVADPTFKELNEKSSIKKAIYSTIFLRTTGFIAMSNYAASFVMNHFPPKKIFVVNPFVFNIKNLFKIPIKEKKYLRFCFLGRLSKEKNILRTISIFSEIKNIMPESTLTIAGDGPLKDDVLSYIENKKGITYIGVIDDIDAFLKNHDVMLLLSTYDTFPCSILEGFAAGIVTFTSSEIGTNELIHDSSFIVNLAETDKIIAKKMSKVLLEDDIIVTRKHNRAAVKTMDEATACKKFREVFKLVVSEK